MPEIKRQAEAEEAVEPSEDGKYIPKWVLGLVLLLVLGAVWFFFIRGTSTDLATSQLKNLDRLELRYFKEKHKFTGSYEELLSLKANQRQVKPITLPYRIRLSRSRKLVTIEVTEGKKVHYLTRSGRKLLVKGCRSDKGADCSQIKAKEKTEAAENSEGSGH